MVANGENAADGNGITPSAAEYLFKSGVDVITTGNHAFRRKEIYQAFEKEETLLRPANYPEETTPGRGACVVDMGRIQVGVINLMGQVYLEPLSCPFRTARRLIEALHTRITVVDFHAEATAEKLALAYDLDGKISALFGTHTHVPTADETILPGGTGYITDVGMTGAIHSVLGVKPELAIQKMTTKLPVRFETAAGESKMDCALFVIDDKSGKTTSVERIQIR